MRWGCKFQKNNLQTKIVYEQSQQLKCERQRSTIYSSTIRVKSKELVFTLANITVLANCCQVQTTKCQGRFANLLYDTKG